MSQQPVSIRQLYAAKLLAHYRKHTWAKHDIYSLAGLTPDAINAKLHECSSPEDLQGHVPYPTWSKDGMLIYIAPDYHWVVSPEGEVTIYVSDTKKESRCAIIMTVDEIMSVHAWPKCHHGHLCELAELALAVLCPHGAYRMKLYIRERMALQFISCPPL